LQQFVVNDRRFFFHVNLVKVQPQGNFNNLRLACFAFTDKAVKFLFGVLIKHNTGFQNELTSQKNRPCRGWSDTIQRIVQDKGVPLKGGTLSQHPAVRAALRIPPFGGMGSTEKTAKKPI
jgi:hypothetical protein